MVHHLPSTESISVECISLLRRTRVHSRLSFVPGPLEVQEETGRHVWMSVMAESLRILQHLSRRSPEPAVAAALSEGTLDKCLELCLPLDQDRKSISRQLRVESIKTLAVLCVVCVCLCACVPVCLSMYLCISLTHSLSLSGCTRE
jgi:hypothetical protein